MGTDLLDPGLACFAAITAVVLSAGAALACDGLSVGPEDRVAAVIDGNTLKLASGIVVRLGDIRAPRLARRAGATPEPGAEAARAGLVRLALGRTVRLELGPTETDRYGQMPAQVYIDPPDGSWVQQEMVAAGLARVDAGPEARACVKALQAIEAVARASRLGIWADPYYSVRDAADPATVLRDVGHFELIEGKVVGTGAAHGRDYVDFGRVWKDDVTAVVDAPAQKLFAAAGLDPLTLKGQRVRIRGWVEDRDGPLVALAVPEQVEVLSPQ